MSTDRHRVVIRFDPDLVEKLDAYAKSRRWQRYVAITELVEAGLAGRPAAGIPQQPAAEPALSDDWLAARTGRPAGTNTAGP
jgi:hypothetical protein